MKNYIFIIIIIFIFLLIRKPQALIKDYTLIGKRIYLDAGHGGIDSGAIYQDIYEKDINLEIVKKLEKELISRGAIVYLTRDTDKDLSKTTINRKRSDLYSRVKLINNSNADLYISIHLNSYSSSNWHGLQIFYSSTNKNNKLIAETITGTINENNIYTRNPKQDNTYYMYKNITIEGVLIEVGFLSNKEDRNNLIDSKYQEKLANYITDGIVKHFQNKPKINT